MIFQPAILALNLAAAIDALLLLLACGFALQVLRRWDIASGSELQLRLERRTYLISTLVAFVMATELASLLLFVFNADQMAVMFSGAMCAVGTLNVNAWGFPALLLKILVFFLAAAWLALNHVDAHGEDYPLVRAKYRLLLAIAPVMVAAALVQANYFLGLRADVITSCCGSLFSPEGKGVAADAAHLEPQSALALLAGALLATLAAGAVFLRTRRGGPVFGLLSALTFAVAAAAIVSAISLYVYEHPHHHCPFCLLKPEYGYFGYLLYLPLFAGTGLGIAAGLTSPMARLPSLGHAAPLLARRFGLGAGACFALFAAAAIYAVAASRLVLMGS